MNKILQIANKKKTFLRFQLLQSKEAIRINSDSVSLGVNTNLLIFTSNHLAGDSLLNPLAKNYDAPEKFFSNSLFYLFFYLF